MTHTKESLELARHITDEIEHYSMHHHYYVLYDIANTYPKDYLIKYVEIGCYTGGSACLMLQRPNTSVISIDLGQPIPQSVVHANVNKLNQHKNTYNYLEGNSQSHEMVNQLKELTHEIDILFIDGDHTYQGVVNDFLLYEKLVKPKGYIVFDDYNDKGYPGTKIAVDRLVSEAADRYDTIGTFPNIYKARPESMLEGNDFIIRKK